MSSDTCKLNSNSRRYQVIEYESSSSRSRIQGLHSTYHCSSCPPWSSLSPRAGPRTLATPKLNSSSRLSLLGKRSKLVSREKSFHLISSRLIASRLTDLFIAKFRPKGPLARPDSVALRRLHVRVCARVDAGLVVRLQANHSTRLHLLCIHGLFDCRFLQSSFISVLSKSSILLYRLRS